MKRFRFRLSAVQRVRRLHLDQARQELCRKLAEDREHEEAQRKSEQRLQQALEALANGLDPLGDIPASLYADWIGRLEERVERAREERRRIESEVADARDAYRESKSASDVMDRLHDRRQAEWRAENDRLEEKANSDTVTARWSRRGRNGS